MCEVKISHCAYREIFWMISFEGSFRKDQTGAASVVTTNPKTLLEFSRDKRRRKKDIGI
jgi:hypothetical protein